MNSLGGLLWIIWAAVIGQIASISDKSCPRRIETLKFEEKYDSTRPAVYLYWYATVSNDKFSWLNYMSVVSAIKFIDFSAIYLLMYGDPKRNFYFTLDEELKENFPELQFLEMGSYLQNDSSAIIEDILPHFLKSRRKMGIIVTTDALVGPGLWDLCFTNSTGSCNSSLETNSLFIFAAKGYHEQNFTSGIFVFRRNESSLRLLEGALSSLPEHYSGPCVDRVISSGDWQTIPCATALCQGGYHETFRDSIIPELVLSGNSPLHHLIRTIMYNNPKETIPPKLDQPAIPNEVHMIWFGKREFHFIHYLSFKSILTVVNPSRVFIHGDVEPFGKYWDRVKHDQRIVFVPTQQPTEVMGMNFTDVPLEHKADVARLVILRQHGGIYSDFDVFWVRPIDQLRYYDAEVIASYDITSHCNDYPNSIQIGVFLARKGSEFLKLWYQGYRYYHLYRGHWAATSMCYPYKIYERHPERVLIDNHLQAIWFNGWKRFVPRWRNEYDNVELSLYDAYAWHVPDMPFNLNDETELDDFLSAPGDTILHKILRFVKYLPDPQGRR